MSSKAAATLLGTLTIASYSGMGMAAADPHQLNFTEPASAIASQIYDQHIMLLWICLAIFIKPLPVCYLITPIISGCQQFRLTAEDPCRR